MSCELVAPVFQQYEQELLGFINKRLKDKHQSEDVLNDVLMKIYRHCEKLPKVRNNRAWLYQITRNALYDYFRENQRSISLEDSQIEAEDQPEQELYQSLAPLLPTMIRMLPAKYAVPLQMSDIEEIPQQQIADKLGLSLSGAKSRIQRGREKLRALFFECLYLELDHQGVPMSFAVKAHCTPLHSFQPQTEPDITTSDKPCNC
ncbi:RNA polymerase sigma factor SigZ [Catalinimonas niigatensis]|uniref:RNA polymerase sigma factor SigZ n=1 Tax=Catalinimonas niigatensis TaxID=1397264 RepID=UPI002665544E|nr:RNA polymerase sigma factor SigZ [Catalinimonas niigatensis]WPP48029.1 RNA polymerase sigma factor SigZ [Catalinimonas niigatensis]